MEYQRVVRVGVFVCVVSLINAIDLLRFDCLLCVYCYVRFCCGMDCLCRCYSLSCLLFLRCSFVSFVVVLFLLPCWLVDTSELELIV